MARFRITAVGFVLMLLCLGQLVWAADFVVTEMGAVPGDGRDDTAAVQAAIDQCQVNPGSRLVFPPGQYDFFVGGNPKSNDISLFFENCGELTVVGHDAELVFRGLTRALFFQDCKDVVVEGLVIDWDPLPFSQGRVVAVRNSSFDIEMPAQFPVRAGQPVPVYTEHDPETGFLAASGLIGYSNVDSTELVAPQVLRLNLVRPPRVGLGAVLVLRHQVYVYNAFSFRRCKNVTVRDVTVYAAAGMGLSSWQGGADFFLKRFRVMIRPGSGRLMSTTADATHFNDCAGTIRIEDCIFEGMGDDAVNVHGMYLKLTRRIDDRTVAATCRHGWLFPPKVGDRMELTRFESLLPYAIAVVKAVSVDEEAENHTIEFETALPKELAIGDFLANATRAPKLRISGCAVRGNRARGFLVQTRDAVIEDNSFSHCSAAGIHVTTDGDYWTEAIGTRRVVIRDNLFFGCNGGTSKKEGVINVFANISRWRASGVGVHRDITIEGNTICQTDNAAIAVSAADGVIIRDNFMANCCQRPDRYEGRAAIVLHRSRNVRVIGNTLADLVGDGGIEQPVYIMPSCDRRTVEVRNNIGF